MSFASYVAELRELRERRGHLGVDNVAVLSSAVSTNLLARDIALDYESEGIELFPALILAYQQSAGRGRQGRSWSSPAGRGVYATLLLPFADPRELETLPLLVGVGLCRALAPHLPRRCGLKWPNDLLAESTEREPPRANQTEREPPRANQTERESPRAYQNNSAGAGWRKLGGILIETLVRTGEPSVAFIGFGVNRSHDEEELPPGATSLAREGGGEASLARLAWDLVDGVMRELAHAGDAAYAVETYRAHSIHRPGETIRCRVGDQVVTGVFLGFDEHGLLRLSSAGRELALSAGEVVAP